MKAGWGSVIAEIIKFLFEFLRTREEKEAKKQKKDK